MTDTTDWRAQRERYMRFLATELGTLYREYEHALIAYWQKDGDDRVSDRKLKELDQRARETQKAFVAKLMDLADTPLTPSNCAGSTAKNDDISAA